MLNRGIGQAVTDRVRAVAVCGVLIVLSGLIVGAQGAGFEVASIKRNVSGRPGGSHSVQAGGRFVATNVLVTDLVQFAWDVIEPQVVEGPDWIRSERFDINARAASEASDREIRLMLQRLLADRFAFAMKNEQREMTVQEVVRSRDDGRLGPGLVQVPSSSPEDCRAAAGKVPKSGLPPGSMVARAAQCGDPSKLFRQAVYSQLRSLAIDKTGLTGTWYVQFYWAPEGATNRTQPTIDSDVPSFATALQEQLGLRLRGARAKVDVVAIKSISRPTED